MGEALAEDLETFEEADPLARLAFLADGHKVYRKRDAKSWRRHGKRADTEKKGLSTPGELLEARPR
jgi:hypothetical protein